MQTLTFVTSNPLKAAQLQRYLQHPIMHETVEVPEVQSLDLYEVVRHKTFAAYNKLQKPVLVEDTAVVFHALGNLPGPLIKWFLAELGNEGLTKLIGNDRRATVKVVFGLYTGNGDIKYFAGESAGNIAIAPAGKGSGWRRRTWTRVSRPAVLARP